MALTVGLHASLLPAYSGGAPLVWSIINGEKKTGISFFIMEEEIDSGNLIAQKETPINFYDTIAILYKRIEQLGIEILVEQLPKIVKGEAIYTPQDNTNRTIYPQRKPEDGKINWHNTAYEIYNFIRAQTKPYPCAFSFLKNTKLKILDSKITTIDSSIYKVGEIVKNCEQICVATKDKLLQIGNVEDNKREYKFRHYVEINKLFGNILLSKNERNG